MRVEAEIEAVIAAWDQALIANDAEAFARFVTDDWVFVSGDGITTKADIAGWIAAGRLAHHSMRAASERRIAVHGETVIVTQRSLSTGAWDGAPYSADEWTTDVFIRKGGEWRCALSHKAATRP
jgi:ketosteroid isomerase-like protein